MLELETPKGPEWLDLPLGVRMFLKPADSVMLTAGRVAQHSHNGDQTMPHLLKAGLGALALAFAALALPSSAAAQSQNSCGYAENILGTTGDGQLQALCDIRNALSGGAAGAAPTTAASTPVAGSVATANTFQSALAANPARKGCTIQNTSAGTLYAYFGSPGSATLAASLQTPAGGSVSCASPSGVVSSSQVSVTSATAGATFVVVSQ